MIVAIRSWLNRVWASALVTGLCVGSLPALGQDSAVPVSVIKVQSADVHDEIPLSGTVTARRSASLSPRVEGYLQRILVDEGDEVEAGDTIVELDRKLADLDLERVETTLDEARVRYQEAVRQRDEVKQLSTKKHVAGSEVATAEAEVAIRAVILRRLRSELARQQELLSRHSITAPFAGVVSAKAVEVGQWVETSTTLVELDEIDHLRVEVPVPQTQFASIVAGTPAVLEFDALPGYTLDATVTTRVPVGNALARTFPVRIDLDNTNRLLAPGMSVRVRLITNPSERALVLPLDAIVREVGGKQSVWRVVVEQGVASGTKVGVQTGRTSQDWIEVTAEELSEGDRVVVYGNERLLEGQVIDIIEEIEPAS